MPDRPIPPPRVFLLSPANCGGARARMVMSPGAGFDLARRLHSSEGAPLGDVFSFAAPLERAARVLNAAVGPECGVVLLGSIASGKYVDLLLPVFGERLLFPQAFVGRGDMSRGGLMLRCVTSGVELEYAPVAGAVRRGQRPPKLTPLHG